MLSENRKHLILRELALKGSLNASEFAASIGTSGMTVRRDLAILEKRGLVERVHGGAVAVPEASVAQQPSPVPGNRSPQRGAVATIGMIVPSASYYFSGVIRGAETAAREAGVRLILGVSNNSSTEEQRQLRRMLDLGVDGILVTPSEASLSNTQTLELLAAAAVPIVVVERSIEDTLDRGNFECVRSDHAQGARIAVAHLQELGHQRIALCLRENSPTAPPLIEGFGQAMEKAGPRTHLASNMVRTMSRARNDPQAHHELVADILDWCLREKVTAAIVHTDEDALQFASMCQERAIQVPEDFAIIAYDDEIAALGTTPLTAVAPPKFDVGHQALTMCANRVISRRPGPAARQRVNLSPTLVVRNSTLPEGRELEPALRSQDSRS
ncbi:substrate-binding domain-containing protein [Paenarthrobacter sp. JL.01a]|uniref:substrate-binding domain-containing protein n=1 Tax=Paenarthrobacter sp. JL.01a TaxID=2979324 RepID=UPI0021C58E20|nr:substrate-binding domain-containing protein [Paenarthrobacter sp. JL.01a]UXM93633.1 substrate-binding domain-containing protein [Paenarthrobacter sp. JL.01a]